MANIPYYNQTVEESFARLHSSPVGLSGQEAKKRLEQYGPNKLPEGKRTTIWEIFFRQFKNILILILLLAAGISFFIGELIDLFIICAAIFINIIVGFIQEYKAEKTISLMKKNIYYEVKVLRDGLLKLVKSEDLVPGDVIILDAGDHVVADARLFESHNVHVNEAVLTGESMPVVKQSHPLSEDKDKKFLINEQSNMIFAGTLLAEGRTHALVTHTGTKTELNKISELIENTKDEPTPLQNKLSKFSRNLGVAILLIALGVIMLGLIKGIPFHDIFMVGVAIAVSAIPEGLIVTITVILVIGMQRILEKKALVRKLSAVETLGSTSVVCVDKTGTITAGLMQAKALVTLDWQIDLNKSEKINLSDDARKFAELILLCNNAVIENPHDAVADWRIIGSPTEKAIAGLTKDFDINLIALHEKYHRVRELPFDSRVQRMSTVHKLNETEELIIEKGAPEIILRVSDFVFQNGEKRKLTEDDRSKYYQLLNDFSSSGNRVLACAYKEESSAESDRSIDFDAGFIFLGLLVIEDPLRPEVVETVKLAKRAGIRTVLITGDYELTAKAIAKEIGLSVKNENFLSGADLELMTDDVLDKKIKNIFVYARVTPEHKLRIVNAWRRIGEVVAMTGDGINDAAALKAADIGIAVNTATEVTKSTADIILLDNNFAVIIEAVKQGRLIFQNIRKVIVYLLADSFSSVVLVGGALLFGWPLPVTAAQILWINLVSDGFPAAALTLEKSYENVMEEKPLPRNRPILDRQMKSIIFIIGLITDFVLLAVFYYLFKVEHLELNYVRTMIFAVLGFSTLLYSYSCKSLSSSLVKMNIFDNKWLNISVLVGLFVMCVPIYWSSLQSMFQLVPLGSFEWLAIVFLGFVKLIMIEIAKFAFSKNKKN